MAYLGKGRKSDLSYIAEQLRERIADDLKIIDLRNLILSSRNYDEEFVREMLNPRIEEILEGWERNLAKENGETQQTNITDENMKDLDDQQPSEKDVVQREDIRNAPTEKCLENVGFEFEKYVDVDKQLQEQIKKDIEYYHNVLKRVIAVVKYLAVRGLAFRGNEEVFGSPYNGNFMGALELLAEFDLFIREHIEQRELRLKSSIAYLSKTIYEQIIEIMGKQIIKTITT
ncbi:zinc finger MYM-type protein 1 [Trichonephila clavipes]|nr:zinc finger MYM-type protein 1 [Trichonephila clavipes]